MSGMTAILKREIVARRDLLLVAVAAVGIVLLMPLMPGLEGYGAADVRNVSANVLALVIGWGMAIGLGASVFGSDLSQGRLGFFFARPVRGLSVWLGRIGAVLLLIFVCEVLILLPSLIGGWANIFSFHWAEGWEIVIVFAGAPLLLVLLSHVVSIMFRARTAWLFLDLAGLLAVGLAAWLSFRPFLFSTPAKTALLVVGGVLFVAVVIGLVAAGAVGLVVGRTDLRRTHGALSLTLWSVLMITVGVVSAYSSWLRSFEPSDLGRVDVLSVDPRGAWIEVEGSAPGHLDVRRRFLVSSRDPRWIVLPNAFRYVNGLSYSADGSRAVWIGSGLGEEARFVQSVDLDLPRPELISTTLTVGWRTAVDLSQDGSTLAMVEDGMVSVYRLADDRLVTAVRLPAALEDAILFFDGPESLRIYAKQRAGEMQSIQIARIALPSGALTRLGEIRDLPQGFWTGFNSDLGLMVVNLRNDSGTDQSRNSRLFDAQTGELIQDLGRVFPRFLADGRVFSATREETGDFRIQELFPGQRVADIPDLEFSEYSRFGGEMLPGQIALSRQVGTEGDRRVMRTDLLDVDSGVVTPIGEDLRIAIAGYRWKYGGMGVAHWCTSGFEAARILQRSDGTILRWDPETGELIHVVGGAK